MKEYTLCALVHDNRGGEWTETACDYFTTKASAATAAKRFGRDVARQNDAKLVDAWAIDDNGICADA